MSATATQYLVRVQNVDYYELLGVDENATASEIRSAYRALAKVMHPDAGGTAGTFRLLREAYETLSDPERRAYYDSDEDEEEEEEPPAPVVRRVARKIVRDDPNYVPVLTEISADTIGWWHSVTVTQAVMAPPIKPDPPVLAAAIAGWVTMLLALLLVAPPIPLLVIWLLALIASGAVLFKSVRRHLDGRNAHKAFMARFGANQIYGTLARALTLVRND